MSSYESKQRVYCSLTTFFVILYQLFTFTLTFVCTYEKILSAQGQPFKFSVTVILTNASRVKAYRCLVFYILLELLFPLACIMLMLLLDKAIRAERCQF